MTDELPTSSAIDTSGDLSQALEANKPKRLSDPTRYASLGPAIPSPKYDPNKVVRRNFGQEEGGSLTPTNCVLVLGTLGHDGKTFEYRVGRFPDDNMLTRGLCDQDKTGLRLKPHMTHQCFSGSSVYHERDEAIAAANATYPRHSGIKVMKFPYSYPVF